MMKNFIDQMNSPLYKQLYLQQLQMGLNASKESSSEADDDEEEDSEDLDDIIARLRGKKKKKPKYKDEEELKKDPKARRLFELMEDASQTKGRQLEEHQANGKKPYAIALFTFSLTALESNFKPCSGSCPYASSPSRKH